MSCEFKSSCHVPPTCFEAIRAQLAADGEHEVLGDAARRVFGVRFSNGPRSDWDEDVIVDGEDGFVVVIHGAGRDRRDAFLRLLTELLRHQGIETQFEEL